LFIQLSILIKLHSSILCYEKVLPSSSYKIFTVEPDFILTSRKMKRSGEKGKKYIEEGENFPDTKLCQKTRMKEKQ